MKRRYTEAGDTLALEIEDFSENSLSGIACAVFFEPGDRVCDAIEHLEKGMSAVIETGEYKSLTQSIANCKKHGKLMFREDFRMPVAGSMYSVERLARFIGALPGEVVVFTDADLLPLPQFRVLNRALHLLKQQQLRKKIVLLIQGDPDDYDNFLQSYSCGWQIIVCPRMTDDDVHLMFLQQGVEINEKTALALLRKFAHSSPLRLHLVLERAKKMALDCISMKSAMELIGKLDSNGLKRPMQCSSSFVSITSAKRRPKRVKRPSS